MASNWRSDSSHTDTHLNNTCDTENGNFYLDSHVADSDDVVVMELYLATPFSSATSRAILFSAQQDGKEKLSLSYDRRAHMHQELDLDNQPASGTGYMGRGAAPSFPPALQ